MSAKGLVSKKSKGDVEIVGGDRPVVKRYQILVLGLACVCICLCAVVLVVSCALYFGGTTSWQAQAQAQSVVMPNSGSHIACLECRKLRKNVYKYDERDPLLEKLEHVLEDGVQMCCADNSEQLSALLELSMQKQEVNRAPLPMYNGSNFQFSPVTAHKRLYPPETTFEDLKMPLFMNDSLVTCHFKKENDHLTEHARGVTVLDDESGLMVNYTGLYYIYSSIQFRPDSAYRCKDFKYQTWGQYVAKLSPNRPAESGCLLKTSHTCCDECAMDDETSFIGGVFYMSAGDVLTVEVSAHGLVYFRKDSSFLGLMMLGSADPEKYVE